MAPSAVKVVLTRIGLIAAAAAAGLTGFAQVVPELQADQAVPWRQQAGWFLLACGMALAALAWRCRQPIVARFTFWRQLAVGVLGAYVLTVLTVGGSAWARYVFRALLGGWIALYCWLASRQKRSPRFEPMWRLVDIAATNAALILVLGELSLRAYAAWTGQSMLVRQGMAACRLQPHRNYGGLLFTNSRGFCSREFEHARRPGVRRIAVLGDSFAVGTVRQEQNFVSVLETLLPDTEVYNFGISGTGPREYYEILQTEVWPYKPDLVLVSFFVGNDVTGWIPLPNTRRMHPECHSLYLFCQRTWRLGREWWQRRSEEAEAPAPVWHPFRFGVRSRAHHLYLEFEGLKICRPSQVEAMEKNWRRSLGHMDEIVAACRRLGVPVVVVLSPDEFQVNPELLNEVVEEYGLPPADIDLELPQRRLLAYCAKRGVPCLDLTPAFVGVPGTFRPRDAHYNEKGNRIAAERIAQWLARLL